MTRLLPERRQVAVNALTVFAIATFGLHIFTVIFLLLQGVKIYQISNRRSPTFVQLVDGQQLSATNSLEREPEQIRQFVSQAMGEMFNWNGTLPPENIEDATNPKPDSGITIKTPQGFTRKVTTSSWIGSFALAEDFRQGFLAVISEMTPTEVFNGNRNQGLTANLLIQRVYPPEKIGNGRWRVGMVANIVQTRGIDGKKVLTPFNKDFLVRAIDTFQHPLPNNITQLQKSVYRLRNQGLEIYEITELCLTDAYDGVAGNSKSRCSGSNFNSNSFTR